MIFSLASTDGRVRACVATSSQAAFQYERMVRSGLTPVLSDMRGRVLTLADLERRLEPEPRIDVRH